MRRSLRTERQCPQADAVTKFLPFFPEMEAGIPPGEKSNPKERRQKLVAALSDFSMGMSRGYRMASCPVGPLRDGVACTIRCVFGPLSAACFVPDRGREWHKGVGTTRGSMLPSHRAVIADSRRPHSRSGTEPPAGGVHREDGRLVRRRFLIRSARRIGKGALAVLRPVRLSFSGVPCCRPRRRLPSSIRCRLRARRCSGRSRPADRFPRKPRRFFRPSPFRGAPGRD